MKSTKMKKIILCMLAVVLVLMLGISCTGTSSEEQDVYELRAHFWMPSTSNTADGIRLTMDLIEERSEGRIQFTDVTWSGLSQSGNLVQNGIYFCRVITESSSSVIPIAVVK